MSQHYRQTQNGRHGGGGQHKQKKDEGDDAMRLSDHEIAGCITDMGVPFSIEDLQRPQPALIQRVFEYFAELFLNITRETVEPAMREAAKDVYGEDMMDIVPTETRNLMGFYASLRKISYEAGVQDLTFTDLTKPTHPRLVLIFSYIINFLRFRQSQTPLIDEHFKTVEETKTSIENLFEENISLATSLKSLHAQRKSQESAIREKTARNNSLKERLLDLKKAQEKVVLDMDGVRRAKNELTSQLAEKTEATLAVQKECERLHPYASQSSAALQSQLTDLSTSLARDKASADTQSRRHRALQTSSASFTAAAHAVSPLITLLKSTSADLHDEENESLEAQKRREALSERKQDVREVERTEALLARQLAGWVERTRGLREGEKGRSERDGGRMRALKDEYERLGAERGERGREVERRRGRVEGVEKKMADLKENIETEIHEAHDEYQRLEAHVRLYITEMEQSLVF